MRWGVLAIALSLCADAQEIEVPFRPPNIPLSQMDARQQAVFFREAGIQADSKVKSFTPEWVGFATPPSGEIKYYNFGNIVFMWTDAPLTATSTDTNLLITNVPSELNVEGISTFCETLDNGLAYLSLVHDGGVDGQLEFTMVEVSGSKILSSVGLGNYTNSGTKGLPADWMIVFRNLPR